MKFGELKPFNTLHDTMVIRRAKGPWKKKEKVKQRDRNWWRLQKQLCHQNYTDGVVLRDCPSTSYNFFFATQFEFGSMSASLWGGTILGF